MDILSTATVTAVNAAAIAKGDFIRAKYRAWRSAHNGIVAGVSAEEIRVLYIGDGANVTNYFVVRADEIEEGLWDISWSRDFSDICTTEEGA